MTAQRWRDEFPVVRDMVFFNHAAVSPLPQRAYEAGRLVLEDRFQRASADYFRWLDLVADTRRRVARLIGTTPDRIAFTGNTSCGLGIVAAGIDWQPGDRVAVTWPDFPTIRFPFDNLAGRGVRVVEIPRVDGRVDMDAAARIIPGCRLVVAATVDFATGTALPAAAFVELCHREGALCCFDAIQGLGVLPLDVAALGVDCLAAGCHKWQLGPMGLGFFYLSPQADKVLSVPVAGWRSMQGSEHLSDVFAFRDDAGRFEPGTQDIAGIATYGASLSLFEEVGIETVRRRIFAVNDALAAGLTGRGLTVVSPLNESERSGILVFAHPEAEALYPYLMERKGFVSLRAGRIRLAPHFYNNDEDVQRFFALLDGFDRG